MSECKVPPPGWSCSRGAGHDGPCAASPTTEGMCACGAALPTFVLMHGGKRCDKCRNAPDATGAMDTIIQKLRRSTQPGLAPLYGFTPAEAELMLARLAPEPRGKEPPHCPSCNCGEHILGPPETKDGKP